MKYVTLTMPCVPHAIRLLLCKFEGEFSSVITRLLSSLKSLHNSVQLRQAQPFFMFKRCCMYGVLKTFRLKTTISLGLVKVLLCPMYPKH